MKALLSVLVLGAFGTLVCEGNLNSCRNVDGFQLPQEGTNSHISYIYTLDGGGNCNSVTRVCSATIKTDDLAERSWFISNVKSDTGLSLQPLWLQVYNLQCPEGLALHLYPQFLDTQVDPINAGVCTGFDFVSVDIPGRADQIMYCGGETGRVNSDLYNRGLGVLVEGGNATIEFCTNGDANRGEGFGIRATCVNRKEFFVPGCNDFEFTKAWDGEFIDRINFPFVQPERVQLLHRRSVPDAPRKQQQKRFIEGVSEFPIIFNADDRITYTDGVLTVEFSDGTSLAVNNLGSVVTTNSMIGTRRFKLDFPPELATNVVGPGTITLSRDDYVVNYSLARPADIVVTSGEVAGIINRIYDYIYLNYILAYPIIEESRSTVDLIIPLSNANESQPVYRVASDLGFIQEEVSSPTCRRAVVNSMLPDLFSRIDGNVDAFCRFFANACRPLLAIACRELVNTFPQIG